MTENSITIQAACGPDEVTVGGYFTPLFTYVNKPENEEFLEELKKEWVKEKPEEKQDYKSSDLPSPMVVTIGQKRFNKTDATTEIDIQNFKLTLFHDAGFFKFCLFKVYQVEDWQLCEAKERVLNETSAKKFMASPTFTVLDYKLKTMSTGNYKGNPLGLFLLDDPDDTGKVVCAHIHFEKGNTNKHTRINLVHHKKPPTTSMSPCMDEDHDRLSKSAIKKGKHKVEVALDKNATRLVDVCRRFVEKDDPGLWGDVNQWNMNMKDPSVKGFFRSKQQRSAWEDSYLKYIENFDIPTIPIADSTVQAICTFI